MATRIGIMGPPNTGKSFSRKFLTNPEEAFVLSSSVKAIYLNDKNGKPLPKLNIKTPNGNNIQEVFASGKAKGMTPGNVWASLISSPEADIKTQGNWAIVPNIPALQAYLNFIDKQMPHIKTVVIPDFTHYISKVIASNNFRDTSGGKAFERFWSLAADSLQSFFLTVDNLRDDLIVVTEFHAEYDDTLGHFKIFVPAGKMLSEKFQPESYFDIMLCTVVEPLDSGEITPECYKFVVNKHGNYNARSMGLFEEVKIPNNLQIVIDRLRDYYQI